jgi:hypothetical protein
MRRRGRLKQVYYASRTQAWILEVLSRMIGDLFPPLANARAHNTAETAKYDAKPHFVFAHLRTLCTYAFCLDKTLLDEAMATTHRVHCALYRKCKRGLSRRYIHLLRLQTISIACALAKWGNFDVRPLVPASANWHGFWFYGGRPGRADMADMRFGNCIRAAAHRWVFSQRCSLTAKQLIAK